MRKKIFGFDLLIEQALDAIAGQLSIEASIAEDDRAADYSFGDTPIERLFHLALSWHLTFLETVFTALSSRAPEQLPPSSWPTTLFIRRQVEIADIGRVDFEIRHYAEWSIDQEGGTEGWRSLIVECDGHDFHERTKEQAAKDRSRDRAAILAGYEVFRFTGSELWCDPLGCARQIVEWAEKGL